MFLLYLCVFTLFVCVNMPELSSSQVSTTGFCSFTAIIRRTGSSIPYGDNFLLDIGEQLRLQTLDIVDDLVIVLILYDLFCDDTNCFYKLKMSPDLASFHPLIRHSVSWLLLMPSTCDTKL